MNFYELYKMFSEFQSNRLIDNLLVEAKTGCATCREKRVGVSVQVKCGCEISTLGIGYEGIWKLYNFYLTIKILHDNFG
jgi:hypothetical protein